MPGLKERFLRNRFFFLSYLMILLLAVRISLAGTGTFIPANQDIPTTGKFNFIVAFRFTPTQKQRDTVERQFINASMIIYDATDGQHQFGSIIFCTDENLEESADFWIEDTNCEIEDCRSHADGAIGDFGRPGKHVVIFYDVIARTATGHYTIAHEFGHLAYNLLDEYKGPGTGLTRCLTDANMRISSACLMDDYYTRGISATDSSEPVLNEFCVHDNHNDRTDRSTKTDQHHCRGQACWTTISGAPSDVSTELFACGPNLRNRYPALPPGENKLPNPGPEFVLSETGAPVERSVSRRANERSISSSMAFEIPTFNEFRRIIMIIDRSGSMQGEKMLAVKRAAAKYVVGLTCTGIRFGVVSFATTVTEDFPLTIIERTRDIQAATDTINNLTASGATATGEGLRQAAKSLPAEPTCPEIFILISDGKHNKGNNPIAVVDSLLRVRSIVVHTVAIGPDADEDTLKQISIASGGTHNVARLEDEPERLANGIVRDQAPRSQRLSFKLQNILTNLSLFPL